MILLELMEHCQRDMNGGLESANTFRLALCCCLESFCHHVGGILGQPARSPRLSHQLMQTTSHPVRDTLLDHTWLGQPSPDQKGLPTPTQP